MRTADVFGMVGGYIVATTGTGWREYVALLVGGTLLMLAGMRHAEDR